MSVHAPTAASLAPPGLCPAAPVVSLSAQRTALRVWLVVPDALVLNLAFMTAYWLRFALHLTRSPEVVPPPWFYPVLGALLTPVSLLVFALFRLYDPDRLLGGVSEYSRIFDACSANTMMLVLATFLMPAFVVS